MKCNVLMLHGYKGTWNNGWFATVQSKLKDLGLNYISPSLPNPANPNYQQWRNDILKIIDDQFLHSECKRNIIIVAHSLACFAILRLIDELLSTSEDIQNNILMIKRIKCIVLVAPIVSFHNKFPQFTNYQLSNLKNSQICPIKTYLIYSLDDNYVDNDVIKCFISSSAKNNIFDIIYIEKQGYMHFMQDDIPFITDLIVDNL